MFGLLKRLFNPSCGNNLSCKMDKLYNAQIGDILHFQEMGQPDISTKQFTITDINYIAFEHEQLPEFTLDGEVGNQIHIIPVEDDQEEPFLMISRKITDDIINELFDKAEFESVFSEGNEEKFLHIKTTPPTLEGWTAPEYAKCIDARPGHFYNGDYRKHMLPEHSSEKAHPIEYTMLTDETGEFVIDIIKYLDSSKTDVYITVYESVSLLDE